MATREQKLKIANLLKKAGGNPDYFLIQELKRVSDGIVPIIENTILPLRSIQESLESDVQSIFSRIEVLAQSDSNIETESKEKIHLLKTHVDALHRELLALSKENTKGIDKVSRDVLLKYTKLNAVIQKIEEDIEDLYWTRTNGSNNVQAVLNVKANNVLVANNVTTLNLGTNLTTVVNSDGSVTINASGGGGFTTLTPTQVPNGTITVFTFPTASAQPSLINRDGTLTPAVAQSGAVYWTWSAGLKQATMSLPPSDILLAVV